MSDCRHWGQCYLLDVFDNGGGCQRSFSPIRIWFWNFLNHSFGGAALNPEIFRFSGSTDPASPDVRQFRNCGLWLRDRWSWLTKTCEFPLVFSQWVKSAQTWSRMRRRSISRYAATIVKYSTACAWPTITLTWLCYSLSLARRSEILTEASHSLKWDAMLRCRSSWMRIASTCRPPTTHIVSSSTVVESHGRTLQGAWQCMI